MQILVVYASRKGSTEEIALAIGKELEAGGHQVMVSHLKDVSSFEGYDAAVMGAPVYTGHIDEELRKCVERNKNGLKNIPIAAFAVGLAPVNPKIGSSAALEEQTTRHGRTGKSGRRDGICREAGPRTTFIYDENHDIPHESPNRGFPGLGHD